MKKVTFVTAVALGCGIALGTGRVVGIALPGEATLRAQSSNASQLVDWLTDGGDNQRTGWARNEKILTKQNVGNLKLLWTLETGNQPRALHSLMPVLVISQLATASGTRQVGIVNGISDNLYAFDVETGKILWQKHWTYRPARWPRRRRRRECSAGSAEARVSPAWRQQRHAGHRPR